jgi:hypothetical protein
MHYLTLLASTTCGSPFLTSLCMVMITLALIWAILSLTVYLVKRAPAHAPSAVPLSAARSEPSSAPRSSGIPSEIVAVIAAAVSATVGKDHKIISIKAQDSNWERAGRQSVLSSHRLR